MSTRFGGRIHFGTLAGVEYPPGTVYRYRADLTPESEGGYSVVVPALPGCYTQGDTEEEALANAREAALGWLAFAGAGKYASWADVPGPAPGVLVRWVVLGEGDPCVPSA
jgi:predicted RNase H-like HicB family nuclease